MKKLLLLALAASSLLAAGPRALAYDKDPWHAIDQKVEELDARFEHLAAKRHELGSSPEIRDQMARLRFGLDRLGAQAKHHAGDASIVRKQSEELSVLAGQIEDEYRAHLHGAYAW